jgi:hypothetical protein
MASTENVRTMVRFHLMSRLGLLEPLVRLQRRIDASNRRALASASRSRRFERA